MNGLPLQFLDGIDNRDAEIKEWATQGLTNDLSNSLNAVSQGYDFAGFVGDGRQSDDDAIYNYLVRTKEVVSKSPQVLSGYQEPKQFVKMLGYVLDNWDKATREDAIENMANEEERLIGLGAINLGVTQDMEDYRYLSPDDVYDEQEYSVNGLGAVQPIKSKIGFFNQLRKLAIAPNANDAARKIVSANPFFSKYKNAKRRKVSGSRISQRKQLVNGASINVVATPEASVSEVSNKAAEDVLSGRLFGLCGLGAASDDLQITKEYLIQNRKVLTSNPEYFDDVDDMNETLGMLDYAIENFDTKNRDVALDQLSGIGMTDDEYDDFLEGLGSRKLNRDKKKFFKNLKKFSKSKGGRILKAIITANPFALIKNKKGSAAANAIATGNPLHLIKLANRKKKGLRGDDDDMSSYEALKSGIDLQGAGLTGLSAGDAAVKYLERTRDVIENNPELFVDDVYEYENVMGVLGFAINHFNDDTAMNGLCGYGMTDEQYEDYEDTLGALGAKKSKSQKKAEKAQRKAAKKEAKAKEKAQQKAERSEYKSQQKAYKAERKELQKQIKNSKNKAEKKALKKKKKQVFFKQVKNATKYAGKQIKRVAKKVWKAIVKYNPLTLLIRAGLLMAIQLNMFKMAGKIYPGTLTQEQAEKLGVDATNYAKCVKGWKNLKNVYTKLGGTELRMLHALDTGSRRVWKGNEQFSKNILSTAIEKNKTAIQQLVSEDQSDLKKAGAQISSDPNVSYEVTNQEVEVEDVADAAINGLIENNYFDGLGAAITVAATVTAASGVIAGIVAALNKMGINTDYLKKVGSNLKNKIAQSKQKKEIIASMSEEQKTAYENMNRDEQNAYISMTDAERATYQNAENKDEILQNKVDAINKRKKENATNTWNSIKNTATSAFNSLIDQTKKKTSTSASTQVNSSVPQSAMVSSSNPQSSGKTMLYIGATALVIGGGYLIYKNSKR